MPVIQNKNRSYHLTAHSGRHRHPRKAKCYSLPESYGNDPPSGKTAPVYNFCKFYASFAFPYYRLLLFPFLTVKMPIAQRKLLGTGKLTDSSRNDRSTLTDRKQLVQPIRKQTRHTRESIKLRKELLAGQFRSCFCIANVLRRDSCNKV